MPPTAALPQRRKFKMLSLASISPEAMHWLWYPYFPYGNVTLIFGRGGIGKSHIALDIAARVSAGRGMPTAEDENEQRAPARVLLFAAEDDPATVIRPRLEKLEANMENIFIPEEFFDLSPRGISLLAELVEEYQPSMIVIDPLVSYLGGKVDMHRMNEVRPFMGGLMEIAKANGIAVLLVHHKKKGDVQDDNDAADLAAGSVDFNNAVRSSVFVTHSNTGKTVMRHVKHNYSTKGPNMSFQIDPVFTWSADGYVSASSGTQGRPPTIRHNAKEFLQNVLANGPVTAADIEHLARDAGIHKRTLDRAKVGVAESFLVLGDTPGAKQWFWRLVGWREAQRSSMGSPAGSATAATPASGRSGTDPAPAAGDEPRDLLAGSVGEQAPAAGRPDDAPGAGTLDPQAGEPTHGPANEVGDGALTQNGEADLSRVASGGHPAASPAPAETPPAADSGRPVHPGADQGASRPVRGVGSGGPAGGLAGPQRAPTREALIAAMRAKGLA